MELTADQIAQRMLDMYRTEKDWCQNGLSNFRNGKQVYCLLGGRIVAEYGDLGIWGTDMIINGLADDEYLLRLAAVIREQYPELREVAGGYWDSVAVIYVFNDERAEFADIRTALEKAAAGTEARWRAQKEKKK